jgi:sigma-B regulation protein RsbU (phosphoserine phosphatase)
MSSGAVEDLEDLYESAPCGYLSVSADGRIAKCNKTLLDWTGHENTALIGSRLSALLSVGSRIYYDTHIGPLLRMQGYVNEIALDVLAADGAKLQVLANAAEKRDGEDRLVFTRLTVFKATDRRRHERDLLAAREAAEARVRMTELHDAEVSRQLENERSLAMFREQFVAVLGHDLRNPLASILSGVGLLRPEPLSERGAKILGLMEGSVSRASRLVDDVMDFARSRLGGGISVARDHAEPLGPVVEHVVSEMRTIAPSVTITLDLALAEPVDCDRSRIAQLLSNLLGNAVTHGDAHQPIHVSAVTVNHHVKLSVANGGKAISEPAMRNLFQPFFRGDARHSQQGLGLGLYIASEIAKGHGGVLSATSDDKKTVFTFTMPSGPLKE